MSLFGRWRQTLDELRAQGRHRRLVAPRGLDFSSNDYLGYGKRLIATAPLSRSGQASRLLRGHHDLWDEVEDALAHWHGAEAVLMMNSGYAANEGLLSTMIEADDFLASDEMNHASIIDGARLTKAERFVFRHNDMNHLETGLRAATEKRSPNRELFIVTEALFGMHGDRAPLPALTDLATKYGAHLIVDEAHSTGCFGPEGSGLVDEAGLRGRVLATVHTGGKALGVCGAYLCCSRLLREMLVNRCRQLIFTTALPPVVASWWLEMLPRVRRDDAARNALYANIIRFRGAIANVDPMGAFFQTFYVSGWDQIVPVVLRDDERAVRVAEILQSAGLDVRAIRPPTVAPGQSLVRISLHADHTVDELDRLAASLRYALESTHVEPQ